MFNNKKGFVEWDTYSGIISGVFSLIVIGFVWKFATFNNYPLKLKILITILVPIVFYVVVYKKLEG